MDLQSVKQKLTETVNSLGSQDGGVQVDWAGTPPSLGIAAGLPAGASTGRGANLAAAVDLLQRRATPARPEASDRLAGAAAPLSSHIQRLAAVAERINALSLEQERSIAEMQRLQAQLGQLRPTDSLGRPVAVSPIDLQRVAVAIAEIDARGRISLACRPVAPPSPAAPDFLSPTWPGSPAARPGRAPSDRPLRHRPGGARELLTESLALAKEPTALAIALGRTGLQILQAVRRLGLALQTRASVAPQLSQSASLSMADSILWFGGGVIGRTVLSLLIAALPMLWSVAVAGITALMAYALYQATLAPRLSFGPLLRASLLVAGLVVGGHL